MQRITPKIRTFHRALHRWYKTHGRRDLPWRNTRDPYAIYVSEIMLQQTQVKTVLEKYYAPFLKKFPTVQKLAQADKQSVMKAWEGLGYYNRAANLHKAAQQCKKLLPKTAQALLALPGIGKNTAHAVACFAYGAAVPVMEANVKRVLCRVFALKHADEKVLWEKAEQLLDKKHPFDYNQAMMDVGALVCKKREPRCSVCPLAGICEGKKSPTAYPAPKVSKVTPVRKRVIVALRDEKGHYYLRQRDSRFLHGLYGFPEYEQGTDAVIYQRQSYSLTQAAVIGQVTQSYSHFTLQAKVHLLSIRAGKKVTGFTRVTLKQMRDLPLSRADAKILKLLMVNGDSC